MQEQIYCSLDLEFTGFDVTRDQILEVGFAFFRMGNDGAEIIEEWSQVFKPTIEVHPKIFGLTGITQEELDDAPSFNEYREFLQNKLGDAILVGHNPVMDVKFLESYGIKLSGKVIDTLELVQFILPTHHSYNLENLMHYFNVAHEDSHRALGDSKTTISILESLLRVFNSFGESLKQEILEITKRGNFSWADLLSQKLAVRDFSGTDSLKHLEYKNITPLPVTDKKVWFDESSQYHEARVVSGCAETDKNFMVAVQSPMISLRLWKSKLAVAVFSPEDVFDESAFNWFCDNASTDEELRFALKVIVWRHLNWQTVTILDLNISFFGGQYRNHISGKPMKLPDDKILVCDYETLSYISSSKNHSDRELVVCGLQEFERHISAGNDTKVTWNGLLYLLKNIYNPETGLGDDGMKELVMNALAGTDLFFGLLSMLVKKYFPNQQYVDLQSIANNQPQVYRRLRIAAHNLAEKLGEVVEGFESGGITRAITFLNNFFEEYNARVRWLLIEEDNSILCDQPLEIDKDAEKILNRFVSVKVTETISTGHLLSYHCERIGLNTKISDIPNIIENSFKLSNVSIIGVYRDYQLEEAVKNSKLPTILVMNSPADIKKFYDRNYREIQEYATIQAQGYSGGVNKMFRNFGLRTKSILLVTADFIAKHHSKVNAGTIIFNGLPQVDKTHPYITALIDYWKPKFPNITELLQTAKMSSVLKKLNNPNDTEIILATDEKLPFEVISR